MNGNVYIINGDVNEVRRNMHQYSAGDAFRYEWDRKIYPDIQKLYEALLAEKEYGRLKDFNECQFLIEHTMGNSAGKNYYPVHMQIEHVSFCNAKCIMCFHYYMGNENAGQMKEKVFEEIKKWLPYVRLIGLHGYGEPFLAKDILKYLREYRKYGIKFYANTNLSVLPDGIEEYYSDFAFINISCDGATKEVFEGIRKNLKFEIFIENVKRLRAQARGVRLVFAVVLMRQNIRQCSRFVEMAAELGVDEVAFSKVGINYVIGNYEDAVENYPMTLRDNLQKALEAGERLKVKVITPMEEKDIGKETDRARLGEEKEKMKALPFWERTEKEVRERLFHKKYYDIPLQNAIGEKCFEKTPIPVKGVCDWLMENIYISAEGKVAFCCSNTRYYVGDLQKESLEEIWHGENYRRMVEVFRKGYLPWYCKDCNLLAKRMLRYAECDPEDLMRFRQSGIFGENNYES